MKREPLDSKTHTFVLCAYKESMYMEECLKSLLNQTVKSNVVISTSTPNEFVYNIAKKYGVEVITHNMGGNAQRDFNYVLSKYKDGIITLAHQDDIYEPEYVEYILKECNKKDVIIAFTNYFEIRDGERVYNNKVIKTKKLMNVTYRISSRSRFLRRINLSFGNAICCPSVAWFMDKCSGYYYDEKYMNSFDWDCWLRLSKQKGRFVYIKKPLMGHRIHEESITTNSIANNDRYEDDKAILERCWPKWIARIILKKYAKSMESNG